MKAIYPVCLIFLVFNTIVSTNVSADKSFIEGVVKYYQQQESMSYDIDYKMKYIDSDTVLLKAKVNLIRNLNDTVLGGIIWYDVNESPNGGYSKYYDGSFLYLIEKEKNEITRFDAEKKETFIMEGGDRHLKNVFFFKPENLLKSLENKKFTINDTVIGKIPYAFVAIKHPDEDGFTNRKQTIYINKNTRYIEKITYYADYNDDFEYQELILKNIKFGKVKKESLDKELKNKLRDMPMEDFRPPTDEETAPLENGIKAPEFTANLFFSNTEIKLSDYKDKIIILDFWYMSCSPCILSIPLLNDMQEKYKNDVVIVGLNPYDTGKKAIGIQDFATRNNIKYHIAQIDKKILKQFRVMGFPTMYIIDKDGNIRYSHIGYNAAAAKKLDDEIAGLLKK